MIPLGHTVPESHGSFQPATMSCVESGKYGCDSGSQQNSHPVFTVEFDPPPSPPRTRIGVSLLPIGRRLICFSQTFLVHKDDVRSLTGSGYLKEGPEGRPGPDGNDTLLLEGIYIDGIQHRQEDTATLSEIGFLPQGGQFVFTV